MADTQHPISPTQANALYNTFLSRRSHFPEEDEQTSFLVTVLNFGADRDDVSCVAGEWSGTKGQLVRGNTIPTCPNGHPLLESPVQHRLGLVEVDPLGLSMSSPAPAAATDHRNLIFPDSFDDLDRAFVTSHSTIPDGAIVDGTITVIAYSDPSGASRWALVTRLSVPTSQAVGMLELAKLELIAQSTGVVTNLSTTDDEEG